MAETAGCPKPIDMKGYLWLVKTNKGNFFITVLGNWTQEEAAKKVQWVFEEIKLDITAMIPRKRVTGPEYPDSLGTIYQRSGTQGEPSYEFLAGPKLWQVCGRGAEYEAELILLKKEYKNV